MSTPDRISDAVGADILHVITNKTLDHALDVALGVIWMVGRAVHGTAAAAQSDPVFLTAHDAITEVRKRLRVASRTRGGESLLVMSVPDVQGAISPGGRS